MKKDAVLQSRKWREENREKYLKYQRTHNKKPEVKERRKKWYEKNKRSDKFMENRRKNNSNYRKKHPLKINAQRYARDHNQRGDKCEECGIIKNLEFHHTNYKKNQGKTLCVKCHGERR